MHIVGGGVCRRLLECLFRIITRAKSARAIVNINAARALTKADEYLKEWRKPDEFVREVRPISDMKHWKMREGHEALLYHLVALLAIPEIRAGIGEDECNAAMCLIVGLQLIYHTTHESPSENDMDEAEIQLKTFFQKFLGTYGRDCVSYKMHCLIHLPNECRIRGAHLGSFDCYPFENWLGRVKGGHVRTGKNVVQQFVDSLTIHAQYALPTDSSDGLVSGHRMDWDAVVDEMVIQRSLMLPPTTIEHVDFRGQRVKCSGFKCSTKYVPDLNLKISIKFTTLTIKQRRSKIV